MRISFRSAAVLAIALSSLPAPARAVPCCDGEAPVVSYTKGGRVSRATLVWPSPPERVRIAFVRAIHSEADIGKKVGGGFSSFKQMVAGTVPNMVSVQRPHDVVADRKGRMFVSDGARRQIVVFDPNTKSGYTIGDDRQASIQKPMGLGIDANDIVYVADQAGKRVVAMTAAGRFVATYGSDRTLLNPVDVAVDDAGGIVWVVDAYLHQVLGFDKQSAKLVRRIGRDKGDITAKRRANSGTSLSPMHGETSKVTSAEKVTDRDEAIMGHTMKYLSQPRDMTENRGADLGEFRYPAFAAVGRDGTLYVTDGMNFRVQSFQRDGTPIRQFGGLGDVPGRFARPKGVAVDSEGNVYVADAAFSNIQIFSPRGELLLSFAGMGPKPGQLWMPLGIYIDRDDRVHVADRFNNRVQQFEYLSAGVDVAILSTAPVRKK